MNKKNTDLHKKPKRIFSTMRIQNQQIKDLNQHLERLQFSAEILNIKYELHNKKLKKTIMDYVKTTQGDEKLKVTTDGKNFEFQSDRLEKPIHTSQGSIIKKQIARPYAQAKYETKLYKIIQSQQPNDTIETIFFDEAGQLTEGNISNVFAVFKNQVTTPPVTNCLPGIMRGNVIKTCQKNNRICVEENLSESMLKGADEIFLTNSIRGIITVTHWEDWQPTSNQVTQSIIKELLFDI